MLRLYSYWRSSASYRVRIALNLKNAAYEYVPVHLIKDGGQQHSSEFRALNPQGRVPLLVDGDFCLGQSLAILEYLESKFPQPALVPAEPRTRARMWAFCHAIAADIQPLHNTGPLQYLVRQLGVSENARDAWVRHWIQRGLEALEAERATASEYAIGDALSYADCLLVPQMYSAERFGCDLNRFPRLHALAQKLRELPAFQAAHPDRQPDAQT